MYSHLSIPILLLVQTVTSFRVERPRECSRVFFFDFEKQIEQGEGGIWQGQEGEVTLGEGKAWLTGRGSLIYPFFSQNDLRPSFAFSFKIRPTRLANNDRVAIITNGKDPGSSTLTVFLNRTCIGVNVIETLVQWPSKEGETRTVELSVDYTQPQHRMKRSTEQGDEILEASQNLLESRNNDSTTVDSQTDTTGEEDIIINSTNRNKTNREALKRIVQSRIPPDTVIAVRPLFNMDNPSYIFTWKKKTTTLTPVTTTTTSTTTYPTTTTLTTVKTTTTSETDSNDLMSTTEVPSNSSRASSGLTNHSEDTNVVNEEDLQTEMNQNGTNSVSRVDDSVPSFQTSETFSGELTTEEAQTVEHEDTTVVPQVKLATSAKKTKSDNFPAAKPSVIIQRPYGRRHRNRVHQVETSSSFPSRVEGTYEEIPGSYGGMDDLEETLCAYGVKDGMVEIEVRLAQDNGMLSLQVGDSEIKRKNIGSMEHVKAPRSALRVGEGDGLQPYRGTFDDGIVQDLLSNRYFPRSYRLIFQK